MFDLLPLTFLSLVPSPSKRMPDKKDVLDKIAATKRAREAAERKREAKDRELAEELREAEAAERRARVAIEAAERVAAIKRKAKEKAERDALAEARREAEEEAAEALSRQLPGHTGEYWVRDAQTVANEVGSV